MFSSRFIPILVFALLPVLTAAAVNAAKIDLGGHVKSLDIVYDNVPQTTVASGQFSANSQRIDLQARAGELEFAFALDNLLLYSSEPAQIALPADSPNRRLDLEHDWQRGERWSDRLAVDRLTVGGRLEAFDWSIGRQAIGFGRIVIFSPLDVIAPFAPDAQDTDVRPGVDAIRGVRYFGLGGQVGGTLVFGDGPDNNSYLLNVSENRSGVDFLGIGGILRDREAAGLGFAGSLGTLGIKAEATYYEGKDAGKPGGDLHDQFTIGAFELWYRYAGGLVLIAQYLYNGAGAGRPEGYLGAAASAAVREGLTFLLGRHYLMIGPSWEFHPLASVSGLAIVNLEDDSALLRPQLAVSLGDNVSLDLFYSFHVGSSPRQAAPFPAIPRSEFGSVGDSGGILLRWYF